MSENQILILKYLKEHGKCMYPSIHNFYETEMTHNDFKTAMDYLKNYGFLEFDKELEMYVDVTAKGLNKLIELSNKQKHFENQIHQENLKNQYEMDNSRLENENLRYVQSIREKNEKISELTIKNLKLQNKQLKWTIFFIILGLFVTFISSNFEKILDFIQNIVK